MATRSLGTLTIDLIAKTSNLTGGMSKAAREVDNEAKRIRRSLETNVAQGANTASDALNRFGAQVVSIAAAWRGLSTAVSAADAWTNANNRIRLVTEGADEFSKAQENVIRIALATNQSLDATASLYQNLAMVQDRYGLSSERLASLVQTINQAIAASGGSAQSASGAIIQLGQAFAQGTLRAEEFNSLVDGGARLVQAFEDGLGVARGSLRALVTDGGVDVRDLISALESEADNVDGAFGRMQKTIGQALTNLRTNLEVFVGKFSDATGAASGFASAISAVGNNLPQVATAFAAFASAKVTQQLADRVRVFRETQAQLISQAKAELANAQAIELKARAAVLDTQAEVRRAAAIGGSVSISSKAAAATLAHRQAIVALESAQLKAAAASNVMGRAAGGLLGFFGGPVGLAVMIATTAASWLLFRDNTDKASQALIDFGGAADTAIEKFKELNRQQQAGEILRLQEEMSDNFDDIAKRVAQVSNVISQLGVNANFLEFKRQAEDLQAQFHAGKISADEFSQGIDDAARGAVKGAANVKVLENALVEQKSAVGTLSKDYERQRSLLDEFTGAQDAAKNATDGNTQAIRDQAAALAKGQKALSDYIGKLDEQIAKGSVALVKKTQGEFAALKVEVGQLINAAGGVDALADQDRQRINKFLATRRKQIEAEEAFDKAQKAAKSSRRDAAKDVRDADRVAKATEAMARAQRDWTTELSGTGNSIMDDYAKRLDDITDSAERFARVGIPDEKVKSFTDEMQRLAVAIKDKELADFSREFDWNTRELAASLDGTSTAAIEYERALYELDKQLKQNLITQEQYDERLAGLKDLRFSVPERALDDLRFELELMKMTNAERATAIQLRGMDEESIEKYGQAILQANKDLEAQLEQVRLVDDMRSEFSGFFEDIISGSKSAGDAFKDLLAGIADAITKFIAKQLVEQLFGSFGTTQSGSSGGWMQQLAGLFSGAGSSQGSLADLFSGSWGFAGGGLMGAYSSARINERGFEMASVNGRDYLLTGNKPVEITPNHKLGGGFTQVVNNNYREPYSVRTQQQAAADVGYRTQLALRRNG